MDQGMQMITEHRKDTASSWSLVSHVSGSTAQAIGILLFWAYFLQPTHKVQLSVFVSLIPYHITHNQHSSGSLQFATPMQKGSILKSHFVFSRAWQIGLLFQDTHKLRGTINSHRLLQYPVHLTAPADHCKDIEARPTS